ncbi:hypothetical protein ACQ5SO_15785 [Rhodovulum sp. DZ06]|uniref:hypothetical protein n=1 Tax=Rhodovulum sp. DZ06 TaxID=3425126 RepID=UPI003D353F16
MTHPAPALSIILPAALGPETPGFAAARGQRAPGMEVLLARGAQDLSPGGAGLREVTARDGADPVEAALAVARGALCMIADHETAWALGEAAARSALFPEPGAARLLILPQDGAMGSRRAPRRADGRRAAALMFRDGAPPPLSALIAPTALLRRALAPRAAGPARGALTVLRAEALGARVEGPLGPWSARPAPCPEPHRWSAEQCLTRAAGLLTPRERGWAARALGAPPGAAPRTGWRGMLGAMSSAAARSRRGAHWI